MALRLEAAVKRVLDSVDVPPGWMWTPGVEVDEKSVAALLHHIGWAMANKAAQFKKIARGEAIDSWSQDWLDSTNREQAEVHRQDSPE